jgi:hypothetical protein
MVHYFQYLPEASTAALQSDIAEEMQRRKGRSLYNHIYGLNTGNQGMADLSQGQRQEELPSWVTYDPMDAFKD